MFFQHYRCCRCWVWCCCCSLLGSSFFFSSRADHFIFPTWEFILNFANNKLMWNIIWISVECVYMYMFITWIWRLFISKNIFKHTLLIWHQVKWFDAKSSTWNDKNESTTQNKQWNQPNKQVIYLKEMSFKAW